MIKHLLTGKCFIDIDDLNENEKVFYDECSDTNLPFGFEVNYGHSSLDLNDTM